MAIIKLKNKTKDGRQWTFKCYYVALNGSRKQYLSKAYMTKKEAIDGEYLFKTKIKGEVAVDKSKTIHDIFLEFYDYQSSEVRETTLLNYERTIKLLKGIQNIKISSFNINHFNLWKKELEDKSGTLGYKNTTIKFLKTLLRFAQTKYNHNFDNLIRNMQMFNTKNEVKKEIEFFTYEEFSAFIEVEQDTRYKAYFKTLYYMGLRKGEANALNWNDINFENSTLTVSKSVTQKIKGKRYVLTPTKNKSSNRTLPIPKKLLNDLKTINEEYMKYKNFKKEWFVFGGIVPLSDTGVDNRKNTNCDVANLKRIRIHDFRHSCASLLINNGASIMLVAKYLGHTKIDMTLNTYTHLYKNQLDDITNLINAL